MKINKIENNQLSFSSKVRISPELMKKFETQSESTINTFKRQIQKLENNNNNDVVVLTSSTGKMLYNGHPVYNLYLQVFEKIGRNVYKSKTPEIGGLSHFSYPDGEIKPFRFHLDILYTNAKQNMEKLSSKEVKLVQYI